MDEVKGGIHRRAGSERSETRRVPLKGHGATMLEEELVIAHPEYDEGVCISLQPTVTDDKRRDGSLRLYQRLEYPQ